MGLVSALLMPLGLERWPLWLMGQGLDFTIAISGWVTTLPGAKTVLPQQAAHAAMLSAFGAVCLALLKGKARIVGILMIAGGAVIGTRTAMPDILVNRIASNAAILNEQGELVPMLARKDRFAVERWLTANGEEAAPAEAAKRKGWTCADFRCTATVKGKSIIAVMEGVKLPLDCKGADIVIAGFPLRENCRQILTRIDRFSVWRRGTHALHISVEGITMVTARDLQGERPWVVRPSPRRKASTTPP
jgi:competence protein ComEC